MSPTLYTAKKNGKKKNGGNMTIRISITMTNNGINTERLRSAFPGFPLQNCLGNLQKHWGRKMNEIDQEEGDLPMMWQDIQGVAWTECIQNCGAEIFCQGGQLIEVSPYNLCVMLSF